MPWLSWVVSNVFLAVLLAGAAWVAQRWLLRPAVAHVLWMLVLVKLVTPPLVSVPVGESPNSLACALGACGCDHHSPTQTIVRDWLPGILLAVWAVGAGTTAGIACRRWVRFRRLITRADPAPQEWQSLAARLCSELSLRCPPEVLAVPGRLPPLVVPGRPRPRLLLPTDLMGQLNASQRESLLLHEMIHLRRRDHCVRMLELAIAVVYWWFPVVGSIGRQLRICEETCCDAAVVALRPHARRDYARLLLDVLDFANSLSRRVVPHATAMSAANGLERRLLAILDGRTGPRRRWPAGVIAAGLACVVLPCELHFQFGGRATSAGQEPDTWAAPSSTGESDRTKSIWCCPS